MKDAGNGVAEGEEDNEDGKERRIRFIEAVQDDATLGIGECWAGGNKLGRGRKGGEERVNERGRSESARKAR